MRGPIAALMIAALVNLPACASLHKLPGVKDRVCDEHLADYQAIYSMAVGASDLVFSQAVGLGPDLRARYETVRAELDAANAKLLGVCESKPADLQSLLVNGIGLASQLAALIGSFRGTARDLSMAELPDWERIVAEAAELRERVEKRGVR